MKTAVDAPVATYKYTLELLRGYNRYNEVLLLTEMNLTVDAQIRFMIQWFNEWSELQRSDFIPVMAENFAEQVHMNGLVNSIANIDTQDKPMSLFQCRIKLFKEWVPQWSSEQREHFVKKLEEIDPTFADKLKPEMQNGHVELNGENVLED